jgi:hypothetical protein
MAQSMIAVLPPAANLPHAGACGNPAPDFPAARITHRTKLPAKPARQLLADTPAVILPEPATAISHSVAASIRVLGTLPGVISAWLHPGALADPVPGSGGPNGAAAATGGTTMVVLVEPGCEGSHAAGDGDRPLLMTLLSAGLLRDALEWDDELALVLAHGYRLCGPDREAFELESLAREIAPLPLMNGGASHG